MNLLTYRQLPQSFVDAVRAAKGRPLRVLFVCLGNICRSPAAEGLMIEAVKDNPTEWEIDSAGTGGWHVGQLPDSRMRAHARRRDLNLTHHCRQVTEADMLHYDLIFGMDSGNIDDLRQLAPTIEAQEHIFPMVLFLSAHDHRDHIPDPYYDGAEGFELVLDMLTEATQNLADTVDAIRH